MKNLLTGLAYIKKGFVLIRQPGMRRYALIPLLVNVIVFAGLGWLLFEQFSQWFEGLAMFARWEHIWLVRQFGNLVEFIFGVSLFIVAIYSFTLVANIIAAPFNSLLAEKVEKSLRSTGSGESSIEWGTLLAGIASSLWSEILKIAYLCRWLIPLAILYVIPGLQPVALAATLLLGAWMFALEYLDYPMGNHAMGFKQVRTEVRKQRAVSLGFGFGVTLMTAIPVINLFAMPIAVAGATALWVDLYPREPAGTS